MTRRRDHQPGSEPDVAGLLGTVLVVLLAVGAGVAALLLGWS